MGPQCSRREINRRPGRSSALGLAPSDRDQQELRTHSQWPAEGAPAAGLGRRDCEAERRLRGQPVPGADARGLATVRRAAAVAEVHAAARQIGAPSPCPRLSPFFCAHRAPAPRGPQSAQRGSLRIAAFFYFLASFSFWSKK